MINVNEIEEKFGITDDYRKAGFITTKGNYLDLSDGQSTRNISHFELGDDLDKSLIEFINQGNIRVGVQELYTKSAYMEMSKDVYPNYAQLDKIVEFIEDIIFGNCVELSIDKSDKNGKIVDSMIFILDKYDIDDSIRLIKRFILK